MRIVILGMMGRCPFGGQTWLYLNWLCGLSSLGNDVWYVEDDTVWPYDPKENMVTDNCSYAVKHIRESLQRVGLEGKWCFRLADRASASWGLSEGQLRNLYSSCDILLNVVGATDLRDDHLKAPVRIYVETDPVTAEIRLANGDEHTRSAFESHHVIATYGENYGAPDCGVPLNGLEGKYVATRQPIDSDIWNYHYLPQARYFTTIGNYRQAGNDVCLNGETFYWSKHHEWKKFLELPKMTFQEFEVALNIDNAEDKAAFESNGWKVISPFDMSLDVFGTYMDYFRSCRGEFTVAKDQNIRLRSGWFSERDVCYLATGKPVIAQDTGFGKIIPTGEGLFAFSSMEEILVALDSINSDYERHCRNARRISQEYFEASKVAQKLLDDIGKLL